MQNRKRSERKYQKYLKMKHPYMNKEIECMKPITRDELPIYKMEEDFDFIDEMEIPKDEYGFDKEVFKNFIRE